jgi:hypothetical protein
MESGEFKNSEDAEVKKKTSRIYMKLATQLAESKQFENHGLMKILQDKEGSEMSEKFKGFAESIAGFEEFDHKKTSLISIGDKKEVVPAVRIPFKTPVESRKVEELRESIDWFYDSLKEKRESEIWIDDKGLVFIFSGNPRVQAEKYSKVLSFAKTRSLYLSGER